MSFKTHPGRKKKSDIIPFNRDLPHSDGAFYEREFISSAAYWTLTATEMHILDVFMLKRVFPNERQRKHGAKKNEILNNGQIVFSYSSAKKLGISGTVFRKSIAHLVEVGFLDIAVKGCYPKYPTKYSLSERWKVFLLNK